jgi:hypothetical protein
MTHFQLFNNNSNVSNSLLKQEQFLKPLFQLLSQTEQAEARVFMGTTSLILPSPPLTQHFTPHCLASPVVETACTSPNTSQHGEHPGSVPSGIRTSSYGTPMRKKSQRKKRGKVQD